MFDNGTWNGGLTGMLQDGRAEIGFCNIWNTLRYNNLVGLGPPWNQMYHTFIVPRPIMVHGYWTTITTLFQRTVWVLLLIIFLLVTIIFSKYKISSENTLSAEKIDTVKDFVQAGYLWGEEAYSNFQQEVYFDLENPWHKKMEQKFQAIPSRKMPAALKSHKIAFPAQRLGQEYVFIVQRSINRSDVSMFRLMKEPVNQFYVSMIFSKLSPILEISQYPLLRFFETGLILHWKNEVIRNYGSPEAARLLTEPSGESLSEFEPLTIDNNLAAFQILLYGLCGSLAVFSLELFSRKKSRVRMLKKEKRTDLFEPYFYCE
ncbi:uncharacterized protein LOC129002034 [Macrosteles quadrilineatus]|uniref:uncharacterized protein LOC129002034 n=1 Tax=Macrosteles quadrilineatus TaxID=74068 RepID=UPI0023E1A64E|nr:uncharacterized protein LOC129002034 [Macrosteles quadrilineatus]